MHAGRLVQAFADKAAEMKAGAMAATGTLDTDESPEDIFASIPGVGFAPLGSDVPQAQGFRIQISGGSLDGPMRGFCVACMTVGRAMNLTSELGLSTTCLTDLISNMTAALNRPTCTHPEDVSDYILRTRLRARGRATTGSHDELVQRYSAVEPAQCPRRMGVTLSTQAACTVNTDCLGVSCCVKMKEGFVQSTANIAVRADPCTEQLMVTVNGETTSLSVSSNGLMEFQATHSDNGDCGTEVFVEASWRRDEQNNNLWVTVDARICNPTTLQCVGKTPILLEHSFSLDTHSGPGSTLDCGSLPNGLTVDGRINEMTISDFDINLRENDINPRCLGKFSLDMRIAMVESLGKAVSAAGGGKDDEFPSENFDICMSGTIAFPTMSVTFFSMSTLLMVSAAIRHTQQLEASP